MTCNVYTALACARLEKRFRTEAWEVEYLNETSPSDLHFYAISACVCESGNRFATDLATIRRVKWSLVYGR